MEFLPGVFRFRFGQPENGTPSQQMYVKPPRREAMAELPHTEPPFDASQIKFTVSRRGCPPRTAAHFRRGYLRARPQPQKPAPHRQKTDAPGQQRSPATDTGDSHAPAPLYFTTAGYGVLVDTARYASFYCGGNAHLNSAEEKKMPGQDGVKLSEAELYAAGQLRLRPDGDRHSRCPRRGPLLVHRPGVARRGAALRAVHRRRRPAPEWGLGCWYRTCGASDAAQVLAMAKELRDKSIPCDVLGLEPGWQSKAYSCSFKWSPERFPQPDRTVATLNNMGYHVNLWEHLFTHPTSPIYRDLVPYSGDFKVWDGAVPDLTLAPASECFASYHARTFTSRGISSFKLDECDNSDFISSPWSFPECSQFPSGQDGETMHSMLGMLYMETIGRACRKSNIRTYGSVRNAHAFAPPQPFVLYSDLYDHAEFIRGVTTCGFSGMLWTPELRHAVSPEDYLRRLQAMVLSPQMLLNIWSMPHPPWRQLRRELNSAGEFYPEEEQLRLERRPATSSNCGCASCPICTPLSRNTASTARHLSGR